MYTVLDVVLLKGVKRKDRDQKKREITVFNSRVGAIDAEHVIRALFQFCIKSDAYESLDPMESETLFVLSTYIVHHSEAVLDHPSHTNEVQDLFADIQKYGRQQIFGKVIEDAFSMAQFDIKLYHMTEEGRRFDPPP